jgi:hypothetical protein
VHPFDPVDSSSKNAHVFESLAQALQGAWTIERRAERGSPRQTAETKVVASVSLARMLSGANAFEISDIQEDENKAALTRRSECNNVTLG